MAQFLRTPSKEVLLEMPWYSQENICVESPFNKVTRLMSCNFIKKSPQHRFFPVNITKCLRKAYFMVHLWWLLLNVVEEFLRISKGGLTRNDLYDLTNLNVWIANMATFCIKVCLIQFITSDLYEEILKTNKSHTNPIIQIVPCKTASIQLEKDFYRRIYKRERFVKMFCSNWRHKVNGSYCKHVFFMQAVTFS